MGRVGKRVDVGCQAGRGRGVDAADMVVDANLLGGRLDGLLDEVHQIRRAQFAQRLQRLGARLDGRVQLVLVDSVVVVSSYVVGLSARSSAGGRAWHSIG